jgi:hypothetical protein
MQGEPRQLMFSSCTCVPNNTLETTILGHVYGFHKDLEPPALLIVPCVNHRRQYGADPSQSHRMEDERWHILPCSRIQPHNEMGFQTRHNFYGWSIDGLWMMLCPSPTSAVAQSMRQRGGDRNEE